MSLLGAIQATTPFFKSHDNLCTLRMEGKERNNNDNMTNNHSSV